MSTVAGASDRRLERSCRAGRPDWVRTRQPVDGVELLQAWFAGRGFDTHRHDTYAIGLTDVGIQVFDYRGAVATSTPGKVVVLHPDEAHDGRAGSPEGFGYRIVYVAPGHIGDAARAVYGHPCALPFARDPVMADEALARTIEDAFQHPEPLAVDGIVLRLTEALLAADASCVGPATSVRFGGRAVARARQLLDSATTRVVASSELEAVTGLTRYELARQFRAAVGTSPYRYSLLRRLDHARAQLGQGGSLADTALATGFADQAHLSRMFKAAFGMTPGRYRTLGSPPIP